MSRPTSHETAFHWVNDAAEATTAEQAMIFYATMSAQNANTNPYQSQFHVRAAAMDEFGNIGLGGNRERTLSYAWIHGETSAIDNLRQTVGSTAIKVISFYNESRDLAKLLTSSPCGPCRDTVLQEASRDTFFTEGNEDIISVSRLRDFLKDDFTPTSILDLDLGSVADGEIARFFSDYEYLPMEMLAEVYGVVLLDKNGNRWRGGLETTSGYDEVSPGYSARIAYKQSLRPETTYPDLDRITVVRRWGLPTNIEYRDRQALLELDEVLMKKHGRTEPLRVDLVHVDDNGPVEAVTTNTLEWLPRPFSASQLSLPVPEQQSDRFEYLEKKKGED